MEIIGCSASLPRKDDRDEAANPNAIAGRSHLALIRVAARCLDCQWAMGESSTVQMKPRPPPSGRNASSAQCFDRPCSPYGGFARGAYNFASCVLEPMRMNHQCKSLLPLIKQRLYRGPRYVNASCTCFLCTSISLVRINNVVDIHYF